MLGFFRKYQRYFYVVITVVIIISFTFFGTYGAMGERVYSDETVLTAVDGSGVTRSQVERLALFLGTDATDMEQYATWGPNFFNDGVLDKDFIRNGLASILLNAYGESVGPDLQSRLARERRYTPYEHPSFKALSASEVWRKYTPRKMELLETLQRSTNPLEPEAIQTRLDLYLSERDFSGRDLKQAISYAERMNQSWVRPDPNLPYSELSLFGYHTVEDWFGPKFVRLASAFIINAAKEAEAKGYTVPDQEVLADLIKNAQISYSKVGSSGRLGVANANEYFKEQLRRLHMDQNQAIDTWRQVMLFRRLYDDIGNAVVTDTLSARQFLDYAKQSVSGDEYALPEEFQLGSFRDLQLFEAYLSAVSDHDENSVDLPKSYKPLTKIPTELIETRYQVEVTKVDEDELATRVGIREMWNWQQADSNWQALVEAFPELGTASAESTEQREKALDQLDTITRSRVDQFTRKQIVATHPEWVEQALASASPMHKILSIRAKGGSSPLAGVDDRGAFQAFLEATPDGETRTYSPNGQSHYAIRVIARDAEPHPLTFDQAKKEGVLYAMVDQELEWHYKQIREANPQAYRLPDGEWKELQYVRDEVAKSYYSELLAALKREGVKRLSKEQRPKEWTSDHLAAVRFVPHVDEARKQLQEHGDEASWLVEPALAEEGFVPPQSLSDQWKLSKKPFKEDRSEGATALTSKSGTWSPLNAAPNGALSFRNVAKNGSHAPESILIEKVMGTQKLLSYAAQQRYTRAFVEKLNEHKAMSLDYLTPTNS